MATHHIAWQSISLLPPQPPVEFNLNPFGPGGRAANLSEVKRRPAANSIIGAPMRDCIKHLWAQIPPQGGEVANSLPHLSSRVPKLIIPSGSRTWVHRHRRSVLLGILGLPKAKHRSSEASARGSLGPIEIAHRSLFRFSC